MGARLFQGTLGSRQRSHGHPRRPAAVSSGAQAQRPAHREGGLRRPRQQPELRRQRRRGELRPHPRGPSAAECARGRRTANLRTKIPGFRGFDSSIILMSRGGTRRPTWNFPEMLSQDILVGIILVGRLGVCAQARFCGSDFARTPLAPRSARCFDCSLLRKVACG